MNIPVDIQNESALVDAKLEANPEVLDLRAIVSTFLKFSWIIVIAGLIGVYIGWKDTRGFTRQYVASMIVSPNDQGGGISVGAAPATGGGFSGVAGAFSAALGIGKASATSGVFDRLKLQVGSRELAEKLDKEYGLLREFYRGRWDEEKGTWRTDTNSDPSLMEQLMEALHQTNEVVPDYEALANILGKTISFEPVRLSGENADAAGFVSVVVRHRDKEKALELLERIYWTADEMMREHDRDKIRSKIDYLQARIRKADNQTLRQMLTSSLIKEFQTQHLLDGNLPYAAEVVVPSSVSNIRTSPILFKTLGLPVIAGLVIGFFVTLLIAVFRVESKRLKSS